MVKIKTSVKQKKSSENTQKLKHIAHTKIIPYSPTQEILESDLIGKAILECLKNNDPEGVMEVIKIYMDTLNRTQTAKSSNIARSTLYHSLRHKNPTIKTLAKIMSADSGLDAKKR